MTKCLNCGSSSSGGYLCQRCLDCKGKRCRQSKSDEDKQVCLGCSLRDIAVSPPPARPGRPLGLTLVEELSLTVTRQAVMGAQQGMPHRKDDELPLPFNAVASEIESDLGATLAGWIRDLEPDIDLQPANDLTSMSAWLLARLEHVQRHPDADELFDEITYAVRSAWRAIDRPANRTTFLVGSCPEIDCIGEIWARIPTSEDDAATLTCDACGEKWATYQWLRVGARMLRAQEAS